MSCLELFVPGRLCLFGEHSDWAGAYRREGLEVPPGRTLITGTDQGIRARVQPAEERFELRQLEPDGQPGPWRSYPLEKEGLRAVARAGAYDSYAAGVVACALERHQGPGLRMEVVERDLPLKKGLSSSAALCVLVARALSRVWDLGLTIQQEMDLAYRGEILTGSACGRMDQACAYGRTPVLLTFDGDGVAVEPLRPAREVPLLVVDLQAGKDTRRILADLNAAFRAGDAGIRRALGRENLRILATARSVLESGDLLALGGLMSEAQELFDRLVAPCSPEELRALRLHQLLAHPAARAHALGGKGVGSQGDGTAQLVCRSHEDRRILAAVLERDLPVRCLELTIPAAGPGEAA